MAQHKHTASTRRHQASVFLYCMTILSQTGYVSCFTTKETRIRPTSGHCRPKQFTISSPTPCTTFPPSTCRSTLRNNWRSSILLRSAESAADISNDGEGESNNDIDSTVPGIWPCFDELDGKLIKIALPVIANFAINPLIGAVDLFWINRMGNALAVAGQAAANQVFNSAFWLASFLPSGA